MEREQQLFFMQRALNLALKGRVSAPPNPWVGAVIVKDGQIVGEGFHHKPGSPHAEIVALQQAGAQARGATLFVTLEPCCHKGKTPPCTQAILESGIQEIVIPFLDPDPQVQGKGVQILEKSGALVKVGILEEPCRLALASYLHHRKTGRPFVRLKMAFSLDGKIAAQDKSSQWITCDQARLDVHQLRAESQAILVGAHTACLDQPRLTVRHPDFSASPLRVVLDSREKPLELKGPLFDPSLGKTLLVTPHKRSSERVEIFRKPENFSMKDLLELLGKRGILQILVEGGGAVWTSFLKEGLVDNLSLYFGNLFIGSHGIPGIGDLGIENISQCRRWHIQEAQVLGESMKVVYSAKSALEDQS